MKNQDWEHEAQKDEVYALERATIEEQEYFEYRLPALITAKIPLKKQKKYDNKNHPKPISSTSKKGV